MESLWLLIVLFFIILLIIPQVYKLYIAFDPINNKGLVIIKIWGIHLKYFSFQLNTDSIKVRTGKKLKEVEYKLTDPKIKLYQNFTTQIKQKIKVKYIDIFSNVGTGNAYSTGLLCGSLNVFYKIFSSFIKNSKPTCSINITSQASFNKKISHFSFFGKISIAIFDFIYCFFIAWLQKDKQ